MVRAFQKSDLYLSIKAVTNQNRPLHSFSTLISKIIISQSQYYTAEQLSLVLEQRFSSQNY